MSSSSTDTDNFLDVAKHAAQKAGEVIQKYFQKELELHNKGKIHDFATIADIESENVITKILKEKFPSHNIIAEESGELKNNSEFTWAIDPIDGTIPFVDGVPTFGVSIGLLKNNQPYLGVIYIVSSKDIYWAQKGKGAFLNGKKLSVKKEDNLLNASINLGFGHSDRQGKLNKHFYPIVDKVRNVYCLGSAVLPLGFVASGILGGYIDRANVWDFAAGAILVEEAGGKTSDFQGKSIDWSKVNKIEAIFSNGLLHREFVKIFSEK